MTTSNTEFNKGWLLGKEIKRCPNETLLGIKNGLQLGDLSKCNPLIVMLKCNFHLNVYKSVSKKASLLRN